MGRLFRAYNEALEPPVMPATSRNVKHLVSPEYAEQFAAELDAFARLFAGEYIDHGPAGAGSWRCRRDPAKDPDMMHIEALEKISDVAPEGHRGLCFECSLIAPPPGWSQAERRARFDAPDAGAMPLQKQARAGVPGGKKAKGWKRHLPPKPDGPLGRMVES